MRTLTLNILFLLDTITFIIILLIYFLSRNKTFIYHTYYKLFLI